MVGGEEAGAIAIPSDDFRELVTELGRVFEMADDG